LPSADALRWFDAMKRVLNVGGGSKSIPLPSEYGGFAHVLLDIDPQGAPDIVLDGRRLGELAPGQFDAIYCSHNLEHYFRHDVPKVLAGFFHVLKPGGFAQIRVPDLTELMRRVVQGKIDLEETLYVSPAGPIAPLDVIYGFGRQIETSGVDFFAHKTGFSDQSLSRAVERAGFSPNFARVADLEINLLAFKGPADPDHLRLFGLA
jgi:SAM-dependent methyltransferase